MKFAKALSGLILRSPPHSPALLLMVTLGLQLPARAGGEYVGDGVPTSLEEEIRWRVNRGRFDSARENTLRGTSYNDIPATAGPLAPHQSLTLAARHHSEDMARNNLFQHNTIPGSAYYNSTTQPLPWDRFHAEAYSYNSAAENIAAGYGSAEAVYVGWWNSTGHRQNMFNSSLREIGDGYFYWSSSSYGRYYTMDLGSRSGTAFFTDTVFHDHNTNGVYDSGEGISGVAVRLLVATTNHADYDLSSAAGSFAVPFPTIAAGTVLTVVLSNTTAATLTLSIPKDYSTVQEVALAPNQAVSYGTFTKPAGSTNVSFRSVAPISAPLVAARLQIAPAGPDIALRWPSETGLQYLPQATLDGRVWTNLVPIPLSGTGSEMSWLDAAPASGQKLYRLLISRP